MVALESLAVGLPIAAARSGGTPDLIEHGVNGLLFEPENEESMRSATLRLFNDPAYAAKLAEAGKARAREKHYPTVIAREHIAIYREALKTDS
jgi:glycosyltransferase involved in cell wall biosynthesis